MKNPSQVLDASGNCKKCGSKPSCRHEIGGSGCDVADYFWLVCPNCGDIDHFCHVDMAGNEPETCPWCGRRANEDPPTKEEVKDHVWLVYYDQDEKKVWPAEQNKIHLVANIRDGISPSGEEASVAIAKCGEEFESWYYFGYPMPAFGTKADAEQTGLKFCERCHEVKS